MCENCTTKFEMFTEQFDGVMVDYMKAYEAGASKRTPAQRANDLAEGFSLLLESKRGRAILAWHYAIALERLAALEMSGVPT